MITSDTAVNTVKENSIPEKALGCQPIADVHTKRNMNQLSVVDLLLQQGQSACLDEPGDPLERIPVEAGVRDDNLM